MPWTSAQVVNAVIANMKWPDHLNQKFMSIPGPPDGARLAHWDVQDVLDWMDTQIICGVEYYEYHKIVHRDLKPEVE